MSAQQAAPVVHLNGYPGCGKLTIGQALADRIGGRLLHNHLALDAAGAVFDRGTEAHVALRAEVTRVLCAAAGQLPAKVPLIVTNALADSAEDRALMAPFEALARARRAPFRPVTLRVSAEENHRRLADPARAGRRKLRDAADLDSLRARHCLLAPEGAVALEVSNMTPGKAAEAIMAVLGLSARANA